ncbi:uncharacterized protein BDZ99DRAFT_514195 [Mytilinidion resinicola]|uniref:NACHT domain-containing protein n=1 Tax=Mytilinidion resinicola TaxID=574789 RepID=A0A6A6ZCC7_9PEZI|nr:uncharacterized protein BDZ99DRAFT_514195 [Mytilinidion resinicola]KAF2817974.1 hypothetical protein BDZ99DRAFT_514195 [Mytilinidion resinicola]
MKSPNPDNKTSTRIRDVFTIIRKKGEVDDLEKRISRLRDQISFHVILSIVPVLSSRVQSLQDDQDTSMAAILFRLDGLHRNAARQNVAPLVDQTSLNRMMDDLREIATRSDKLEKTREERSILQSLQFEQMRSREDAVKKSHETTIEWIWATNFLEWMETGNGIFWIAGKPGSGKSTISGTAMEKSMKGLLQTLLFSIFSQCPALVHVACASKLRASAHGVISPWTQDELKDVFRLLRSQQSISVRYLLLVDGLDEFGGQQRNLLEFLETLATCANIKICVSSRAETPFIQQYGDGAYNFYMQNFTRDDIRHYVTEKLRSNGDFERLCGKKDRSDVLISKILSAAEGVWLWVYLVIQSILDGITNDDSYHDLQYRIEELPHDLEEYFQKMLSSLDSRYKKFTARALLVTLETESLISYQSSYHILEIGFLEDEIQDPDYALAFDAELAPAESYYNLCERANRRIATCCKGFLETSHNDGNDHADRIEDDPLHKTICPFNTVQLVHRTAADFLKSKEKIEQLQGCAGHGFDSLLAIAKSAFAEQLGP